MRFNNRILKMSYILKRNEYRKILMTHLGLTSTDVDVLFDMNKNTLNIPRYRIIKNSLICQKYNIEVESLEKLHYFLKLTNNKLEHRINIFKDVGVPVINTSLVSQIIYHLNTKVSTFKERVKISEKQNIAENIFNGKRIDISELEVDDDMTLRQYYRTCLLYCKNRLFDLPYLNDKVLLDVYTKMKSISMIIETLKVLRIDLHYDDEMIMKKPEVIMASADNIKSLLSNFTDIVGIPIVTCLKQYPFILFQDVDNIKRLLALFTQYNISNENVRNYMKVFTLNNEVFHKRIEMIKRHSKLNTWYNHPRMTQIICQIVKTKERMKYVDIMDASKWANPQVFLSSKTELDKSIQSGIVSTKYNLKHVLKKELGIDNSELLMRHQHWKTAGFNHIVKMLKYLKKHFMINEICPNIHLVLYKQSQVKKTLAELKQKYSRNKEYSFTNSQYLALCLYMLEKDHHFTGDGIWNNEQNAKQQLERQDTIERSGDLKDPI